MSTPHEVIDLTEEDQAPPVKAYQYFQFDPDNVALSVARFNALFDRDYSLYGALLTFEEGEIYEPVLTRIGRTYESRREKLSELNDQWLEDGLRDISAMKVVSRFSEFMMLSAFLFFAMNLDDIISMLESMKEWAQENDKELLSQLEEVSLEDLDEGELFDAFEQLNQGDHLTWEWEMNPIPVITLSNKRSKK